MCKIYKYWKKQMNNIIREEFVLFILKAQQAEISKDVLIAMLEDNIACALRCPVKERECSKYQYVVEKDTPTKEELQKFFMEKILSYQSLWIGLIEQKITLADMTGVWKKFIEKELPTQSITAKKFLNDICDTNLKMINILEKYDKRNENQIAETTIYYCKNFFTTKVSREKILRKIYARERLFVFKLAHELSIRKEITSPRELTKKERKLLPASFSQASIKEVVMAREIIAMFPNVCRPIRGANKHEESTVTILQRT